MKTTNWTCSAAWVCLGIINSGPVCGEEWISAPCEPSRIVNQALYKDSSNACAPASLLNALKFGDPDLQAAYGDLLGSKDETKFRYVVDRFFRSRTSTMAPDRKRWGFHGVYARDLAQSCNDLLAEKNLDTCESGFLDRGEGESDRAHALRVYDRISDSLKHGFPPILSLRSFVVRSRPENNREPGWEMVYHHYVVIQSVPASFAGDAAGFEAKVLDSYGAKVTSIYLHPEPNGQPFNVLKGNDIEGTWVTGRPFLLVTAPGVTCLRPANLKWSERYLVTANFLIGRF